MFGLLTDSIDNALKVTGALVSGEEVQRRDVAKLIADGVEIATVATLLGVGVDQVKRLLDE